MNNNGGSEPPVERHGMFKSGWIRLWIVLTCLLLVSTVIVSSFYVWGRDVSYRFVSVSIAHTAKPEDRQLAESVKQEATTKTFVGKFRYSPLLTLESLAGRGVVTQVGVQWLEPGGWSFSDHDSLTVFNKPEITVSEMISRVSGYVHSARLHRVAWLFAFALGACVAALALGIGAAWIRRAFWPSAETTPLLEQSPEHHIHHTLENIKRMATGHEREAPDREMLHDACFLFSKFSEVASRNAAQQEGVHRSIRLWTVWLVALTIVLTGLTVFLCYDAFSKHADDRGHTTQK